MVVVVGDVVVVVGDVVVVVLVVVVGGSVVVGVGDGDGGGASLMTVSSLGGGSGGLGGGSGGLGGGSGLSFGDGGSGSGGLGGSTPDSSVACVLSVALVSAYATPPTAMIAMTAATPIESCASRCHDRRGSSKIGPVGGTYWTDGRTPESVSW